MLQMFCQAANCGALFFICAHCNRGQRYCSAVCRQKARRQQWRDASRRHQQSPEGRIDHRDRQRAYRQRKASSIQETPPTLPAVTHQGSASDASSAKLPSLRRPVMDKSPIQFLQKTVFRFKFLICQFCHSLERFVNPYHALN